MYPRVSAQQTTKPIRLTPSDHSGCELTPDPSVDSQGWGREWVHKQKPEILQQTILVHIDMIFKMEFHPKNHKFSKIEDNATSELSTDTYYNISETIFKLQNHI